MGMSWFFGVNDAYHTRPWAKNELWDEEMLALVINT